MKTHDLLLRKAAFFLLFAGFTFMMAACDITDLEEEPKDIAVPANYYETPGQMESVFSASMDNIWSPWSHYTWAYVTAFGASPQVSRDGVNFSTNHGAGLWNDHFANVMQMNHVLASLEETGLTGVSDAKVAEIEGEAKFLRAWNYFQLVRLFGDLPLPTHETEDYFNSHLPRSPVSDVYDLIVSDLTDAVDQMPTTAAEPGRPDGDVAQAILAKVYLTMATAPLNEESYFQDARDEAWDLIQSGRYSLVEDINEVFSFETEYGPEMMWSFISTDENPQIQPHVWSDMHGWGDQSPSIWWVEQYPDHPRKYAYLEIHNRDGEHYSDLGEKPGARKHRYGDPEDMDRGHNNMNFPIIRYADVLLIFAEAENQVNGGPTSDAVWAVNQVINRANEWEDNSNHPTLDESMNMEDFDEAVIRERDLELCLEYDRWYDMIRKRIVSESIRPEFQDTYSESSYLWPIPESEIRTNDNISQEDQNVGY